MEQQVNLFLCHLSELITPNHHGGNCPRQRSSCSSKSSRSCSLALLPRSLLRSEVRLVGWLEMQPNTSTRYARNANHLTEDADPRLTAAPGRFFPASRVPPKER